MICMNRNVWNLVSWDYIAKKYNDWRMSVQVIIVLSGDICVVCIIVVPLFYHLPSSHNSRGPNTSVLIPEQCHLT